MIVIRRKTKVNNGKGTSSGGNVDLKNNLRREAALVQGVTRIAVQLLISDRVSHQSPLVHAGIQSHFAGF
jgi:hypothetical protein